MKNNNFFSLTFICFIFMNISSAIFLHGMEQTNQYVMIHASIAWAASVGALLWFHWERKKSKLHN